MADQDAPIIHLKVGEAHVLRFKGRGTAGYEWNADFTGKEIIAVKREYIPSEGKERIPDGASSDEQFTITALQKGKTEVHFTLSRSWEAGIKPAEESKYIIEVE